VTSLTGEGAPLGGSGEARLLGDLTFISGDSEVLGSSTVELAGVDNTSAPASSLPRRLPRRRRAARPDLRRAAARRGVHLRPRRAGRPAALAGPAALV
jgi:hypothetical protein